MSRSVTDEDFKRRAADSANPLLDLSQALYVKATEKVAVSCKKHNTSFSMTPRKILQGQNGCPDCSGKNRTTEDFVRQAERVHGQGKFDYSQSTYRGMAQKVSITCQEHGEKFSQRAQCHLKGKNGCSECNGQKKITVSSFIERSENTFGKNLFGFSALPENFVSIHDKVTLTCLIHDEEFKQSAWSHLQGKDGCFGCNPYSPMSKNRLLEKSKKVFPDKDYDYSNCDVSLGVKAHVEIVCPIEGHGSFTQTLDNHLSGREGCRSCISFVSKAESDVYSHIRNIVHKDEVIETSLRGLLKSHELDIYIPSKQIAIEFNGIYWHTESKVRGKDYHYNKWLECREKGIQLITIWEDDWRDRQELVKNMLEHKLGLSKKERVFARNTEILEVSRKEAVRFYEANHIQGHKDGLHIGLKDKVSGQFVSLSTWKKQGRQVSLERFATDRVVVGGFSKILEQAKLRFKEDGFKEIVTFADHCVSDGGLYEANGFTKSGQIAPDYMYVVNNTRFHKFSFRKKRFEKDEKLLFEEGFTERQLAELNKIPRIWDCGKTKYSMSLSS